MKYYTVDKIIGKRFNEEFNEYEYKIKWKGYTLEESTWEPLSSLEFVMDLVSDYDNKLKLIELEG